MQEVLSFGNAEMQQLCTKGQAISGQLLLLQNSTAMARPILQEQVR